MSRVLAEAVRLATGLEDADPRTGQQDLADDIADTLKGHGPTVGRAPTGIGKSLALLAPAFEAAIKKGQRTWISTESLALQEQIGSKDAPVVAAATERVMGSRPTFATLKGFSNYLCPIKVEGLAANCGATLEAVRSWSEGLDLDDDPGDVHSCTVPGARDVWHEVSTSPAACAGEDCPLFDACFAQGARRRAGSADVVIGNHSLLSVQAATGATSALGSKTIGYFDHLMIDEAHRLPDSVRSQGAMRVSRTKIEATVNRVSVVLGKKDRGLRAAGMAAAANVGAELDHVASTLDSERIPKDMDPLSATGGSLTAWCSMANRRLNALKKTVDPASVPGILSLKESVSTLSAAVRGAAEPVLGSARWIETEGEGNALVYSPVDVGPAIHQRLFHQRAPQDPKNPLPPAERELIPLNVVCVSGTLPANFVSEVGLSLPMPNRNRKVRIRDYASPFDDAYEDSQLYLPRLDDAEAALLMKGRGLNTTEHGEWAIGRAAELVEASGGGALVLFSSSATAKAAVETIRRAARGRWNVIDQWDPLGVASAVHRWREDMDSVLVGTRSLMTGVDGKGETCRMVVLDRIPRAAPNPLDDARTEQVAQRMDISTFKADVHTYVSDAACLLEQAAGRLIRSVADRGIFALLDPRMDTEATYAYRKPTLRAYQRALSRFQHTTHHIESLEESA